MSLAIVYADTVRIVPRTKCIVKSKVVSALDVVFIQCVLEGAAILSKQRRGGTGSQRASATYYSSRLSIALCIASADLREDVPVSRTSRAYALADEPMGSWRREQSLLSAHLPVLGGPWMERLSRGSNGWQRGLCRWK